MSLLPLDMHNSTYKNEFKSYDILNINFSGDGIVPINRY